MRIRSVHPGYWKDDVVVEDMGWAERGFFIALWTVADDAGVFEWKPKVIKRELAPGDDASIESMMDLLAKVGMLCRYELEGRAYGAIRNFCKWQRPKSRSYKHPRTPEIDAFVDLPDPDGKPPKKRKDGNKDGSSGGDSGNAAALTPANPETEGYQVVEFPTEKALNGPQSGNAPPLSAPKNGNQKTEEGVGEGVGYIQPVEALVPNGQPARFQQQLFTGRHREKPRARPPDGGAVAARRAA